MLVEASDHGHPECCKCLNTISSFVGYFETFLYSCIPIYLFVEYGVEGGLGIHPRFRKLSG